MIPNLADLKIQYHRLREHLESDMFEMQLDQFAQESGLVYPTGLEGLKADARKIRIATKSVLIVKHCRNGLGSIAVQSAGVAAAIHPDPQFVAAVTTICTSAKAMQYIWIASTILKQNKKSWGGFPTPAQSFSKS